MFYMHTNTDTNRYASDVLLYLINNAYNLSQGSPTLRPLTGTGLWPVRNRESQQEVSGSKQAKLHGYLQLLPSANITTLALPQIIRI